MTTARMEEIRDIALFLYYDNGMLDIEKLIPMVREEINLTPRDVSYICDVIFEERALSRGCSER